MVHDLDNIHYENLDEDEEFENYFEFESPSSEGEGLLDEDEEMALAAELLNISDDEELEQFFGKIFKKVKRWGKRLNRATGGRLGKALKKLGRRALTRGASALGNYFAPGVGGAAGGFLGGKASDWLGWEFEGLDADEQEFEVARKFVRFATQAAADAADNEAFMPSSSAVNKALVSAAKRHAPGLLKSSQGGTRRRDHRRGSEGGRWVRKGRHIVLIGA